MEWLYILSLAFGLPLAVPFVMRAVGGLPEPEAGPATPAPAPAVDSEASELASADPADSEVTAAPAEQRAPRITGWSTMAFVGFAGVVAGVTGLITVAFEPATGVALAAPIALGLAAGAVHPDVLQALRRRAATVAEVA